MVYSHKKAKVDGIRTLKRREVDFKRLGRVEISNKIKIRRTKLETQ